MLPFSSVSSRATLETPLVAAGRPWWGRPENQLLALVLLAAFPLYYELGRNPVQLWDESRVALNAAEMARDGHWLVPHFDGRPDHWNTKPPLLVWLQALSFKAFGLSTWALRLPTLLASLGTVALLFRFAARVLRQPLAGLLAGLVLVTSVGYVRLHVARTGDYDALLTFWQVLLWTAFFQYLENGARRHLAWLTLALIAATLTKGPAALLGLPGLLAYAVGRRKLSWLLRQPGLYAAAGLWLLVIGGYLLAREAADPGYWQAVQDNDLGGRFLKVVEGHEHTWSYYLENMLTRFYGAWLETVGPALLLTVLLPPTPLVRRAAGLLAAFVVGWLVVISSSKSRLEWYDAPIYPALALLIGMGMSILIQDLRQLYRPRLSRAAGWLVGVGLGAAVFYGPYSAIIHQLIEERHSDYGLGPDGHLGRYVTKLARERPEVEKLSVLFRGGNTYDVVLLFYKRHFEQRPGRQLTAVEGKYVRDLSVGTVVTLCDPAYRVPLDSAFQLVELHQDYPCQTVLLLAKPK